MSDMRFKKRSFRLMNTPDIETRVVIIMAAINSPEIGPSFILKNGVSFRMSNIITRNIMKIEKKSKASLTEISVETFFRFSPKKVPISCCQVSEIMIVSFQGFTTEGRGGSAPGIWYLVFGIWFSESSGFTT